MENNDKTLSGLSIQLDKYVRKPNKEKTNELRSTQTLNGEREAKYCWESSSFSPIAASDSGLYKRSINGFQLRNDKINRFREKASVLSQSPSETQLSEPISDHSVCEETSGIANVPRHERLRILEKEQVFDGEKYAFRSLALEAEQESNKLDEGNYFLRTEFFIQKEFDSDHPKAPRRSIDLNQLHDTKDYGGSSGNSNNGGSNGAGNNYIIEKRMQQRRRQKLLKRFKESFIRISFKKMLQEGCPFVYSLKNIRAYKSSLLTDLSSGISEGIMAVPMGMSYALLACMPPAYGLYNGIFFPLVYMFFGTTKEVSVGVSAIEALLCSEAITRVLGYTNTEDITHDPNRIHATIALSLVLGITQIIMRFFNLGIIAHFIADPVLHGFTTASAFLIGSSQLKHFVGLHIPPDVALSEFSLLRSVFYLLVNFKLWRWSCIGVTVISLLILACVDKINKFRIFRKFRVPGSFCVVVLFTATTYLGSLHNEPTNLPIVGNIPDGFISPAFPTFFIEQRTLEEITHMGQINTELIDDNELNIREDDRNSSILEDNPKTIDYLENPLTNNEANGFLGKRNDLETEKTAKINLGENENKNKHEKRNIVLPLIQEALTLSVMFFIIHISICKKVAYKQDYSVNTNQELLTQGLCNVVGSFFHCFPCASSLSRTSVIINSGCATILHNATYVLIMVLVVTVMTPLMTHLPFAVLAAIVLNGVYGMLGFSEAIKLLKLGSLDGILWLVTFLSCVILGAVTGIIISIVLSVLWILRKTARPSTAILGRLPHTNIYRNVNRFPMASEVDHVKVFRFDSSLNFSNADFFSEKIKQLFENFPETLVVVVDASSINEIDITGIRALNRLARYVKETRRAEMIFANWKGPMRDFLESTDFYSALPPDRCFLSLHDAVLWSELHTKKLMAAKPPSTTLKRLSIGSQITSVR